MARSQRRSNKKETGTSYNKDRKKRKFELERPASLTRVGENKVKKIRTLGGSLKNRALQYSKVIIIDKKKKVIANILRVVENKANRHFVRMNVMTKGAIIETDKGKVRITNQPGQSGQIQGVFA
ncbi:MAG: 30S ribosomal protein S8e [Candidatus Nanoarchaeia archaeon]|nr:30S ribosomal protein S8e [Candidatus Nanoarchaeia archaeon]MDD5054151.1 30S ribosomal protein S8e [Candidatus Nanoarchaeia archaeon]MDD5499248.1 30S ribosomal protein S8e [Candidatus Nanoarchaeia archaeon]